MGALLLVMVVRCHGHSFVLTPRTSIPSTEHLQRNSVADIISTKYIVSLTAHPWCLLLLQHQ